MPSSQLTAGTLSVLALAAGCASSSSSVHAGLGDAHQPTLLQPNSAQPTPLQPEALGASLSAPVAARPPAQASKDDHADLAKKLSNPLASLVSVPFQFNYDEDIGPNNGERWVLNIQPVVPIKLNEDWNVISRTIVPIMDVEDVRSNTSDDSGLGDITQSFFFSPVQPTADGAIWGVGPAILLPTATDDDLGQEQLGIGPTGVILKQEGHVTIGALANQIWSIADDSSRADVNALFFQPFVTYTTPQATTFGANLESTYDWQGDDAAIPLNAFFAQMVNLAGHTVQIGAGIRYWLEPADNGPEEWGFRFFITPLFPK